MTDQGNAATSMEHKGYLFSIRVGGGPDVFTAWTAQDGCFEPFTQATGDSPGNALRALIDRIEADRGA